MIVLYVIGVAIGLFMIAAAIFNWDLWFYDAESYIIQFIGGETAVRWYWAIFGVVWIAAVVAYAFGWRWGEWLW